MGLGMAYIPRTIAQAAIYKVKNAGYIQLRATETAWETETYRNYWKWK